MAGEQKWSFSDYLAAERTLLAWIRTGLALMGFGFVLARFGLFLQEFQIAAKTISRPSSGFSIWFGTALIVAGVAVNAFAGYHHARLLKDMDRGAPSRSSSAKQAVMIAFFLAIVGLAMATYLVSIGGSRFSD